MVSWQIQLSKCQVRSLSTPDLHESVCKENTSVIQYYKLLLMGARTSEVGTA